MRIEARRVAAIETTSIFSAIISAIVDAFEWVSFCLSNLYLCYTSLVG